MQPDKPKKSRSVYGLLGLIALSGILCGIALKFSPLASADSRQAESKEKVQAVDPPQNVEPTYQTYELENADVHVVKLPAGTRLSIAVADELTTVEEFAQRENALAVLNGGFFDPQNGKTTSTVIINGQIAADPADNERLIGNPNLSQYIDQILRRSEFRAYQCRTSAQTSKMRYEITAPDDLTSSLSNDCTLVSLIGAGPQLLPQDTSFEEGFTDYENGELIRDAIGSTQPNARSAIALTPNNDILIIMVAQRPDAPGLTLPEVADFAASIGAVKLLNLDGGSSSSLYYDGHTYLGRLGAEGNPVERPVKSVIVVDR